MEQFRMESIDQRIEQVAELVSTSERIIVFTGAGVSTESGIPDFRGPDGIWSKYDPEDFSIDRFLSDSKVRKMHWEFLTSGQLNMTEAQPNPAHYAIAELEKITPKGRGIGKYGIPASWRLESCHMFKLQNALPHGKNYRMDGQR